MAPDARPRSFHDRSLVDQYLNALPGGQEAARSLRKSLYRDRVGWQHALDRIGADLARRVSQEFSWSVSTLVGQTEAEDGSTKALWTTRSGEPFESVLLRHPLGRTTVCVSCQTGCVLGCAFCSTGERGAGSDLGVGDILDQVAWADATLAREGRRLRNVVFMGMGEPLLTLNSVGSALKALTDQQCFEVAPRYICVSTCGVTPAIEEFAEAFPKIKLAVSLHAPRQDLRDALMPGCRAWPIDGLFDALDGYHRRTKHRLFFEYVMIAGVNDSEREAQELGSLLAGRDAHVNLIPFNSAGGHRWQASSRAALDHFQAVLAVHRVPSTVRRSAGESIAAACGQLAGNDPGGKSNGSASSSVEA